MNSFLFSADTLQRGFSYPKRIFMNFKKPVQNISSVVGVISSSSAWNLINMRIAIMLKGLHYRTATLSFLQCSLNRSLRGFLHINLTAFVHETLTVPSGSYRIISLHHTTKCPPIIQRIGYTSLDVIPLCRTVYVLTLADSSHDYHSQIINFPSRYDHCAQFSSNLLLALHDVRLVVFMFLILRNF